MVLACPKSVTYLRMSPKPVDSPLHKGAATAGDPLERQSPIATLQEL
jgi:hypothetical protein